MYFVKTPKIFQFLFKDYIWETPDPGQTIYITFDDGPHKEITPQVLEILDEYKAKATFFVLGENVEKHPGLIEQIKSRAHSIGSHTYSHLNGWKQPTTEYLKDIEQGNQTLKTRLFRPPFGKLKKSQAHQLKNHYKLIYWTVMPGDFDKNISKEQCLARSINNTKEGTIIVFHENDKAKQNMLFTLPLFLKHFSEKGFAFKAIKSEMFL
jgi:peptidoglycan/xylan/chitin deacetylase (PgdA/CDA1 family)